MKSILFKSVFILLLSFAFFQSSEAHGWGYHHYYGRHYYAGPRYYGPHVYYGPRWVPGHWSYGPYGRAWIGGGYYR